MSEKQSRVPGESAKNFLETYADAFEVRVAIQAIPILGPVIDGVLGGAGASIQQRRVMEMISELREDIDAIKVDSTHLSKEDLHNATLLAMQGAARARTEEKRKRFAHILTRQIAGRVGVDEAEITMRLLDRLGELHVRVLQSALSAAIVPSEFDGRRVITITDVKPGENTKVDNIRREFSTVHVRTLRLTCAELVSSALLEDIGIGGWDMSANQFFGITDAGVAFLQNIKRPIDDRL